MRKIIIHGDDSSVLSVRLEDILNCFETRGNEVFWGLLWVYATITQEEDCDILKFEGEINKSKHGKLISLGKMLNLFSKIDQAIELLMIGDSNVENIRRYESDELMYENCEYIIELVDSSYWLVCSKDGGFIQNIFEKIQGVEYEN
ncbi:hypothetical protein [Sphingobacterium multivorum]|uniref:hypothetical protein n=1 Tax=Sphingobacterium multivorum TaxID=28454 RepID=UPI0031BBC2F6